MRRTQRRILEATAAAAMLSGAPSTLLALARERSPAAALAGGLEATRAIGTLVAPGRPGLVRGAVAHGVVSLAVGELLGATLPVPAGPRAGAAAGLTVGIVALGIVAPRRYPAVAALPLIPQIADNAAFGLVFALVADRTTGAGARGRASGAAGSG